MVTSVAVSFMAGKRYLSVCIDGRSAALMEVADEQHCIELLGLMKPELTPEDREAMALRGGGCGVTTAVPRGM